jgi:hypothetical protein
MKGEALPNYQMDQITKFGWGMDYGFANSLVPKFHLGTFSDTAKFHFAPTCVFVDVPGSAMKLPQQVRSQVKLGNEGNRSLPLIFAQDDGVLNAELFS